MARTGSARRLTEPFSQPGYRPLWTGAVLFALGAWTERVAVGWYVFDTTDSAFLTAIATAAFIAPGLLVGPVAGALSDRLPRPNVLAAACLLKATTLFVIGLLILDADAPLPLVVALLLVSGVGNSMNLSSLHTLSGDLVGAARRARAISLVSTGQRAVSAVGALTSGAVIGAFGATPSFIIASVALILAAVSYRTIREPTARHVSSGASFLGDTIEGLRLVTRVPIVALLLGLTVIVEIFGFAHMALFPVVAERLLEVGPTGLGALTGAASVGGVIGTLLLAAYSDRVRLGVVFLVVIAGFGVLMTALGISRWFVVSLAAAAGIGCCAAMFDALQWILLQAAVPDALRGRALGAWNVAIGFGWLGPILLGAIADATNVTVAFAVAGIVLMVTAALVSTTSPRVRALAS